MNDNSSSAVTVVQFVTMLIRILPHPPYSADYIHYGYQTGWLEDMDITSKDEVLLRKNAARIIHEFMRLELQEPELTDVSCATKLKDLYDCRVCAKHVMQIYAKGIIDGYHATDTLYLFGMNEPVTYQDADIWISRIIKSSQLTKYPQC